MYSPILNKNLPFEKVVEEHNQQEDFKYPNKLLTVNIFILSLFSF